MLPPARRARALTHAAAHAALPARVAHKAHVNSVTSGTTINNFPRARPRPDVAVETGGAARVGFCIFQMPLAVSLAAARQVAASQRRPVQLDCNAR